MFCNYLLDNFCKYLFVQIVIWWSTRKINCWFLYLCRHSLKKKINFVSLFRAGIVKEDTSTLLLGIRHQVWPEQSHVLSLYETASSGWWFHRFTPPAPFIFIMHDSTTYLLFGAIMSSSVSSKKDVKNLGHDLVASVLSSSDDQLQVNKHNKSVSSRQICTRVAWWVLAVPRAVGALSQVLARLLPWEVISAIRAFLLPCPQLLQKNNLTRFHYTTCGALDK